MSKAITALLCDIQVASVAQEEREGEEGGMVVLLGGGFIDEYFSAVYSTVVA